MDGAQAGRHFPPVCAVSHHNISYSAQKGQASPSKMYICRAKPGETRCFLGNLQDFSFIPSIIDGHSMHL